jgi:hypothetical protein
MDNDLKTQLQIGRKEFLEKEAKIYFDVYREVIEEVKYYCNVQGVSIVLRYNSEGVEGNEEPQKILQELNKSVVYSHPSIDITDLIVGELNRRAKGAIPAGQPIGGVPPKAGQPNVGARPGVPLPR